MATRILGSGLLFFAFLMLFGEGQSQYLNNPSLEGQTQEDIPPDPWFTCDDESTPDTQPGEFSITKSASDKNTYISMVARGNKGPHAQTTEDCSERFRQSLKKNRFYILKMDLARSEEFGHNIGLGGPFLCYCDPVQLSVYRGMKKCDTAHEIMRTPPVRHTYWKTYTDTIGFPTHEYDQLALKVQYARDTPYFGSVLVDHFRLKELAPGDLVDIPNAFTPNGDGQNEYFKIEGLRSGSALTIYNRWGQLVYQTENYQNNWQGKEVGTGVYFYVLRIPFYKKEWSGYVHLMR